MTWRRSRIGGGCYATVLTHKGKLRTDLRILRGDDWFWLDTEAIGHAVLEHMLRTYSLGRDVQYEDVTASRALLSLVGPAARERLDAAPPVEEHAFVPGEHGMYVATLLGVDVICEPGTTLDVAPVSEEAAECVRIEAGRPRLGYDMDADTIPQEAGINERAVSFTKGCYVGQETVARLHYRGKPNRHLRGLLLSEPAERGSGDHARRQGRWAARLDLRLPQAGLDCACARAPRGRAGSDGGGRQRTRRGGRFTVPVVGRKLTLRLSPFERDGLDAYGASQRVPADRVIRTAILYYLREHRAGRSLVREPTPGGSHPGGAVAVEVDLGERTAGALAEEAAADQMDPADLARDALLLFLADVDSGRIASTLVSALRAD